MTFPLIAASVLAADFGHLHDDLSAVERAGVDLLHWDVMDGHFVPNISFGPAVIASMRKATDIFFDVHLMVQDPAKWIDPVIDAGANAVSFHAENDGDLFALVDRIKRRNIAAGLAINPGTSLDAIDPALLGMMDRVIVMTVAPGFGGQKFIDQSEKIAALRARFPELNIVVDGGVNTDTAAIAIAAGATTLVTGSALFHAADRAAFIAQIKQGGAHV